MGHGGIRMNKPEAGQLLATQLTKCRQQSYDDLVAKINAPNQAIEVLGSSGTRYYVAVVVHWDSEQLGNVRVIATIDDGGARAFVPMSDDFIMAPDGSFVGETA